ncbi:MAG: cupin domain-containing protein [Gemmatimonadota bacterium]
MSNRPNGADSSVDVVSDILDAVHLTTAVHGRLEAGAPWRLRIPARGYLSFYIVARGSAWIEVDGVQSSDQEPPGLALSAGDAVLLPRGSAHTLRDGERSEAPPQVFDYAACPQVAIGESARFGGGGAVTSLVTGQFTFGGTASRNPLLSSLPPLVHLPANATAANPQLAGVVSLILSESASPGPGANIVLARLADLLLIHALRYWIATKGAESCGLRAVADPAVGTALRVMHARPAEPWTVERLAKSVALSRSAFAERFTRLVGEPPLQYLARWRMTKAALLLTTGDRSISEISDRVGYANAVAFNKAFSRVHGIGPGAYRRAHRASAAH